MDGYNIFLMVELARGLNVIDRKLEYDLTWKKAQDLYIDFEGSDYNDSDKGEYECIEDFLENEVPSLNDIAKAEKIFQSLPACDLTKRVLFEKLSEEFGS